jgi:energy-coupling factor transport system ATP-binding protein
MPDFIKFENASFSYFKNEPTIRPALSNINLTIEQGEFIALIGANGSGKSTLAKMLNALLLPDSGNAITAGLDTRDSSNHAAIRARVGMVFQHPQDQIVATTVEEDVAFGPSNLGLPPKEVRSRVEEALSDTGLTDLRERPSFLLSAGETQQLALAGVLAMRPQCIIFDETTAMLDPSGREMVLRQAKALNRQEITIILITHLMQEAAEFERVIVLHEGQLLMDQSPAVIFSKAVELESIGLGQPIIHKIASRLKRFFPALPAEILLPDKLIRSLPQYQGQLKKIAVPGQAIKGKENPIIDIQNLSYTYLRGSPLAHQALNHLTLQVETGQMHSLIGATGSGKSTLLQHINGLLRPQTGSVLVGDFNLNNKNLDVKSLRRKVMLAFQQPEDQIFEQYVGDEVAYAPRNLGFEGKLAEVVETAMHSVGLDFMTYKDRLTSTLSGGERRKVALASVLAVQADILLLDEPLSGLDPLSSKELISHLKQAHQSGITMLISTHQYEELVNVLDQVSVIHQGKDILHGGAEQLFSQVKELNAVGLRAPLATRIAEGLRSKGWPLSQDIASLPRLELELDAILSVRTNEPI